MSYIGIILVGISLISVLMAYHVSENMRYESERVLQNKLNTLAWDMGEQIETMQTIAYKIALRPELRPDHRRDDQTDPYERIKAVWRLKDYQDAAVISDSFFLKYQEDDTIYTSTGSTMRYELYLEKHIQEKDRKKISVRIEELCQDRQAVCIPVRIDESSVLMIYPIGKYLVGGNRVNGVCCFEVTDTAVENRIRQMMGDLGGELVILYEDTPLYGNMTAEMNGFPLMEAGIGDVHITYRPGESEYFSWENILSTKETILISGMILFLLALALWGAWKNYAPIRNLTAKYSVIGKEDFGDELEGLDALITSLLEKAEKNEIMLKAQYDTLREHMLRLISTGGYVSRLQERIRLLNIRMDGEVFGKIACVLPETMKEDGVRTLERNIEELSDEDVSVYSFLGEGSRMIVLVSAREEYQIMDTSEALGALLEAVGLEAQVSILSICHDLKQMKSIGIDSRSAPEGLLGKEERKGSASGKEEAGREEDGSDAARREERKTDQVIRFIEEHCTEYDLSLDSVAQEFHLSSAYLCRLIKQETNIGYKEYLTRLRIERAKKLLQNKNVNIADVCRQVGYVNVSYFIKVFQKSEGTTPAKYRDES